MFFLFISLYVILLQVRNVDAHVSRIVAVVRWEVVFIELSVITGNMSQIPDKTQISNSLKFCDTNSISELPDFTQK